MTPLNGRRRGVEEAAGESSNQAERQRPQIKAKASNVHVPSQPERLVPRLRMTAKH